MLKRLSFGQYAYKNSPMHRLDPRLKILYTLVFSILIFLINGIGKIVIFSLFVFAIILLSRLGIKNLVENLRPFFLIFAFIFVMYLLFSRNRLEQGVIAIWRFLMLIMTSLILTYTTTISSLVNAIERLAVPLKFVGVKPRNIAVMISITIRFVPLMFLNMEKLREAMLAKLANFRKLRHLKLIVIALLERMLKSALNLSDAMQSRLYDENIESRKIMRLCRYDYASIALVSILVFVFVIY